MRVSDQDRQRAVAELRRHCAAGRLDVDEYAGRVEDALSAASLEDLDRLLADLPMMRIEDPVGVTRPLGSGGTSAGGEETSTSWERADGTVGPSRFGGRLAASLVLIVTAVVVLGAVVLALAASWIWSLVLLAGWALGLTQGRMGRRR
jgi:hypothetical protein